MVFHKRIQGTNFSDERGGLNFFNTFDLTKIVRMYEIMPADTHTIRAWQGHKEEKKWFYCNSGSFTVNLVQVADFENPAKTLQAEQFRLEASDPSVLEISGGYATGFKAREANSKLIVFSNFSLEASKNDDFRYPVDFWSAAW